MKVGGEVQSLCRKCGESWHVVVAMTGSQVAQVECGNCGARHRYRPVGAKTAGGATRTRATGVRRARAVMKPAVEADLSRPPRPFRVSDTYAVGDRVEHANFGEGVVQALKGPTKVEIHFAGGPRVLIQGRNKA